LKFRTTVRSSAFNAREVKPARGRYAAAAIIAATVTAASRGVALADPDAKTKVKNGKGTLKKTIRKEATSNAKQAPQDLVTLVSPRRFA